MEFKVSKYIRVDTPVQMWDLCQAIYIHSEYTTDYEYVYRDKVDELRYKYENDAWVYTYSIIPKIIEKENLTLAEFSLEAIVENTGFQTAQMEKEMMNVLDDVVDYIILNTNLESYSSSNVLQDEIDYLNQLDSDWYHSNND